MGEFINFEVIRNCIKINDKNLFYSYLKDIYKDLSERSENKTLGISKLTFYNYIKLPVFITDKLFEMLDKDNDGFLCLKEFTDGLYFLYIGSFEECVKSVFDIYDFDKDGQIVIGDLKVILSYLPLLLNAFILVGGCTLSTCPVVYTPTTQNYHYHYHYHHYNYYHHYYYSYHC